MRRVPTALAIILVAGGLALWLPSADAQSINPRDELGAAILAGAVVGFAVLIAGQALAMTEKRASLAQAYVGALAGAHMSGAMAEALRFLALGHEQGADAQWASWIQEPADERAKVVEFMNFLEQVAHSYNKGYADRQDIMAGFGNVAVATWTLGASFIHRLRGETGDPAVFSQWEMMVTDMTLRRPRTGL